MKAWFAPFGKNLPWLRLACAVTTLAFFWVYAGRQTVPTPYYEQQLQAAQTMVRAMAYVAREREARGIALVPEDINGTGLIGVEYSPLTTTLAPLWVKRTSTNPDFAALVVRFLHEGGVREGDTVAVGFSGSFPALNLAVIAALDAMGVRGVIISSAGSSSWGANHPQLTWPDLEEMLYEGGIIRQRSIALSAGGATDDIAGYPPQGRDCVAALFERFPGEVIATGSLAGNIQRRLALYAAHAPAYQAYINVGGSLASLGNCRHVQRLKPGLNKLPCFLPRECCGPVLQVAETGVVINLLDISSLALKYNLPIDPRPLPVPGTGAVYYQEAVPAGRLLTGLALSFLSLVPALYSCIKEKKEKRYAFAPWTDLAGIGSPKPCHRGGFSNPGTDPGGHLDGG